MQSAAVGQEDAVATQEPGSAEPKARSCLERSLNPFNFESCWARAAWGAGVLALIALLIVFGIRAARHDPKENAFRANRQAVINGFEAKSPAGGKQRYTYVKDLAGGITNFGIFQMMGEDGKSYVLKFTHLPQSAESDWPELKALKFMTAKSRASSAPPLIAELVDHGIEGLRDTTAHFLMKMAPGKPIKKALEGMSADDESRLRTKVRECADWFGNNGIFLVDWNDGNIFYDVQASQLTRIDVEPWLIQNLDGGAKVSSSPTDFNGSQAKSIREQITWFMNILTNVFHAKETGLMYKTLLEKVTINESTPEAQQESMKRAMAFELEYRLFSGKKLES